ncbi:hypothetical protein [Cryobacterium sp. PH31-L1]|uniref:hypothetical protein n=1 Tax=Cryobacterium sp. PH31-L1 TaxID=3046199 RepID=UPI0024BB7565|nr:hypothetical protein [Cryobacterium sp. PH31-L1]MDJ0376257.1 hypothetical protein [Cryobacterium sp. PH31-L1]
MSPKVAGWFGMAAAAVIAGAAGLLIANSAASILGALVLVGATILFSVAAVWTLRRTWADKVWPPGVSVSASRIRRRQRIGAIVQCVLSPLMIALSVVLIVAGSTWAVVYIFLGVINGVTALWTLKVLRDSASRSE